MAGNRGVVATGYAFTAAAKKVTRSSLGRRMGEPTLRNSNAHPINFIPLEHQLVSNFELQKSRLPFPPHIKLCRFLDFSTPWAEWDIGLRTAG